MAFVVVHMVVPMMLFELFHKFRGMPVAALAILAAGIGGILPDFDFGLGMASKLLGLTSPLLYHGGVTHTLLFAFLFFIAGAVILLARKRWSIYAFAMGFGVILHLMLDAIIGGGAQGGLFLLYPFSEGIYSLPIHTPANLLLLEMIDAVVFILWLAYLFLKGNVKSVS